MRHVRPWWRRSVCSPWYRPMKRERWLLNWRMESDHRTKGEMASRNMRMLKESLEWMARHR